MSLTLTRSAAGLALLAALAAGCGTVAGAATHHHGPAMMHAAAEPAKAHHDARPVHQAAATPAAPPATAAPQPANPIPQGNGGDHDADNNGGPSDGDGDI